jgi:hypothetical protein
MAKKELSVKIGEDWRQSRRGIIASVKSKAKVNGFCTSLMKADRDTGGIRIYMLQSRESTLCF